MAASVEPRGRGSPYYDLAHGGCLELEALNAEVVRRGRQQGIQTPLKPYIDGASSSP